MAKCKKHIKSTGEKSIQRRRTALNKIKACERAMKTSGEPHTSFLKERIEYWRRNG